MIAYYVTSIIYYLLSIIYYLLLIAYYSLLITHNPELGIKQKKILYRYDKGFLKIK
jgi:hypothetical protein